MQEPACKYSLAQVSRCLLCTAYCQWQVNDAVYFMYNLCW